MPRSCSNCGTQLNEGTKFCPGCGAAIAAPASAQQNATQYAAPVYGAPVCAGNGAVRQGIPAPGYSDRVNHPEIRAAVKKNRKAAGIFAFFLVPLPVIGAVVYTLVSKKTDIGQAAMIAGAATGGIGTVGAGMNAQRTEMYSEFAKVRKVKAYPCRNLIKVNERFGHNQVYAAKEDFEFVKDYILSHCGSVKK